MGQTGKTISPKIYIACGIEGGAFRVVPVITNSMQELRAQGGPSLDISYIPRQTIGGYLR